MGENENIVSLDCAAHQQYCHESDIVSFPTIRLYHKDGHFDRYRGPRKAKEYVHAPSHLSLLVWIDAKVDTKKKPLVS